MYTQSLQSQIITSAYQPALAVPAPTRATRFYNCRDSFQSTRSPRFGFETKIPFDGSGRSLILTTDFKNQISNAEVLARFKDVLAFVSNNRDRLAQHGFHSKKPDLPEALLKVRQELLKLLGITPALTAISSSNVPFGNVDTQALNLLTLAVSRKNQDVFVHVCDPGVGNGNGKKTGLKHDRTILISEFGTFIGPNNGSLGLITQSLAEYHHNTGGNPNTKPYRLLPIDIGKVEQFERLRLGDPQYKLPNTFHGRDLFAVIAAAVLRGVAPEAFANLEKAHLVEPKQTAFAQNAKFLPLEKDVETEFVGVQDLTFGNIKTSLKLTAEAFQRLRRESAVFEIRSVEGDGKVLAKVPLKDFFGQVPPGQPLLYHGSSYVHPGDPNTHFLEIAINLKSASDALGVDLCKPKKLIIRRVV